MNRGELWWVQFDPSIGSEIQKTRPAVIISSDLSNEAIGRVQVVPITSNIKRFYPSDAPVTLNGKKAKAMANQLATADKSRLKSRIGSATHREMEGIEEAIKIQLGMD